MPEKWPAAIPDASTLPRSRSRDQLRRLHGRFIAVKICSTFSRSPIHTRFPEEFDAQIKLQRPDQAAGFAAYVTLFLTEICVAYRIEHAGRDPKPFSDYKFRIFSGDRMIARWSHDYRGDEHFIEFLDGSTESYPVGQVIDFVKGGGPKPLVLTARGVAYLDQKLGTGAADEG